MVTTNTIEGIINATLWFHYDVHNDVLHLQFVSTRGQETFGEETSDGLLLFRTDDEHIAGMTIVDYWKRFGSGDIETLTLSLIQQQVEKAADRLSVAA